MSSEDIVIETIRPEHAKALEQLQRDSFPTLADNELMLEDHFLNHCQLFPDGNFAIHQKIGEVRTPFFICIRIKKDGSHRVFYSQVGGGKDADQLLKKLLKNSGL